MDNLTQNFSAILTAPMDMDRSLVGGKAGSLAELANNFRVPSFFVVLPKAIEGGKIRDDVKGPIEKAIGDLGEGPFAVRSSGIEEDGEHAAHAGQFDTELNIKPENVAAAVCRVWLSGFSETVKDYRRSQGLSQDPQPPAIVVQKMVPASSAGVAFSADPVSGDRSKVVISAVEGLADQLVSGECDGDHIVINKHLDVELYSAEGDRNAISNELAIEIAELCRQSEAHYSKPQDIEWAYDGETLHLLQSRPITSLPDFQTALEESAEIISDDTRTIWDNSNIVESYPGMVSPLTFSFARYIYSHVYQSFSVMMGVSRTTVSDNRHVFENMLGTVDGRVYYNLINWYRALALFPGFTINRAFMEQMMGVDEPLPEELTLAIAQPQTNIFMKAYDGLNLLTAGLGLLWHDRRLAGIVKRFYVRLEGVFGIDDEKISELSLSDLAREYRKLESSLLTKWDAPIVNDFMCMVAFGISRKKLEKWAGEEGKALHGDMLIGQGNIISAEPARRIADMGRLVSEDSQMIEALEKGDKEKLQSNTELTNAITEYLKKFGDRCTQELKLESQTLHENPSSLYLAIAAAARRKEKQRPEEKQNDDVDYRFNALFQNRPVKRVLARKLMSWTAKRVQNRENLRFERTRLFGRVRRIFKSMGAQCAAADILENTDDVFFLTVEEVLGLVDGTFVGPTAKLIVSERKKEFEVSRRREDPPSRIDVKGANAIAFEKKEWFEADTSLSPSNDDALRTGLACCRGEVTAKVRVIDDPTTQSLEAGEILVARHTDPGWIAVFANASGVIAERGSLLSHSAIVAREMGVPCIVSIKQVTQWLKTGDLVRLNGTTGEIEILKRAEQSDA